MRLITACHCISEATAIQAEVAGQSRLDRRSRAMRRAEAVDHDPAESLMREVGAQLRQVRLRRGEDLDDVAQHLRIKSSYLFALEQGDLSGMPGRAYALGFLRSYADYLGFDGADLIGRIKSTVDNLTDQTRLRVRTPAPETVCPRRRSW